MRSTLRLSVLPPPPPKPKRKQPKVSFQAHAHITEQEYFEKFFARIHMSVWLVFIFLLRMIPPACLSMQDDSVSTVDSEYATCYIDELVKNNWTFEEIVSISKPEQDRFCKYKDYDYKKFKNMNYSEVEKYVKRNFAGKKVKILSCDKLLLERKNYIVDLATKIGIYCNPVNYCRQLIYVKNIAKAIGGLFGGLAADLFGRRRVGIISSVLWCAAACCSVASQSFLQLVICQCICRIFGCAVVVVTYVNLIEMTYINVRFLVMFTDLGHIFGMIIIFYLKDAFVKWEHLQIVIAICISLNIFICWYVPESPRWLLNKRRKTEAYALLKEVGSLTNVEGTDGSENLLATLKFMARYIFLKKKKYFAATVVLAVSAKFFFGFIAFGALKMIHYSKTQDVLGISCGLCSFLHIIPMFVFFGKRYGLFVMHMLCSATSILSRTLSEITAQDSFNFFTFEIMQMGSVEVMLHLYVAEYFPTFVRATIVGLFSTISGVTWFAVVFIETYGSWPFLSRDVVGVILSFTGFLLLVLPETKHLELPNQKLLYLL